MTLLEVLLALAIFLFSLVAISSLFNTATDQAVEIRYRSRATRLAQSKLNEYVAGVRSLQSGGSGNFDEEPEWEWKAEITADSTAKNLYRVTVTVSRDTTTKGRVETSLSQYVFDPKSKGSIAGGSTATTGSTTTDPAQSTGSTNTGTNTNTGGGNTGGANTGGGNSGGGNTGGGSSGGNSGGGRTGGGNR